MSFRGKEFPSEVKEALYDLVRTGLSCTYIAAKLNLDFGLELSRSSISGKIHRMREKSGDDTFRPGFSVGRLRNAPNPNRRRHSDIQRLYAWKAAHGSAPTGTKRNPAAVIQALKSVEKRAKRKLALIEMTAGDAIMNPTEIWDLKDTTCRWPLWADDSTPHSKKRYCGAKSEEGGCPYCAGHMQMATGTRVRGNYMGRANKWTVTGGSWRAA